MDLSLVIATFNRCDRLKQTLARIEDQQIDIDVDWELVIVDNRSTDQTSEFVTRFAAETNLNVTVVHESTPGLGNARNAAIKVSSGEIVAFTDDDCLPADDFLQQILDVFREDADIGFVGGRILLHDPSDQPITILESTVREEIPAGQFIEAGVIHGANFSFRRKALIASGGFDPFFGAGSFYSGEDVDAIARVSAVGWKGAYDPRPLVFHHHGRKTAKDVESLERIYAHGRGAYYAKCIVSNQWSRTAWKQWYWSLRRKPLRDIICEALGGISFLSRNFFDRGRRFQAVSLPKPKSVSMNMISTQKASL